MRLGKALANVGNHDPGVTVQPKTSLTREARAPTLVAHRRNGAESSRLGTRY